ncbi:MAG TPA: septum formation family protein [Actinomycetes bacterium]|nr:septum formation family protein [Actinomycetes bacterium]
MGPRPATRRTRRAAVVRLGQVHRNLGRAALLAALAVSLVAGCSGDEPAAGAGTPGSGSPTASARPTSAQPSQAALPTPKGTAIDVTGLKLGDCFTEPSGELVERITRVDCSGPHDAEIYAVPRLPSSARYPGDATLEAQADRVCTKASGVVDQDKLPGGATIGYFFPTADNWSADGGTARCYIATDDQPLLGSVRR